MDYVTVGKTIYTGKIISLYCCMDEKFDHPLVDERFRIIFINSGTGVLGINGNRLLFNSPAVFCLNETEEVKLQENSGVSASSVYFEPSAINSALNFTNIRGDRNGLSATEKNDCTCLSPFYTRSNNYHGQLNVGITDFRSMQRILQNLSNELNGQSNKFWPCRSRSYLIEILFLLQRIFLGADMDGEILLNNTSELVTQVMFYLHSNYGRRITMDELSKHLNINRTTLNEKFRNETGMTAIAYLIDFRIRLACLMLRDTLIPVTEIAERVGFNDMAHFTRTFRKMLQHSPSDYRQMNSWQLR